jgi:hypothetical protein
MKQMESKDELCLNWMLSLPLNLAIGLAACARKELPSGKSLGVEWPGHPQSDWSQQVYQSTEKNTMNVSLRIRLSYPKDAYVSSLSDRDTVTTIPLYVRGPPVTDTTTPNHDRSYDII